MQYKIIRNISIHNWKYFLKYNSQSNIFQSPEIYEVYKKTKNYDPFLFSAINEKGDIHGILLVVIQKEHSGILGFLSSRSIIWGGPLLKNNNREVLDLLLTEYNRFIKSRTIYTQFRNLWKWDEELLSVFSKHGYKVIEHLDILHDLAYPPIEQLMKMHKGRRKNIRRAIKKNVDFCEITNKNELVQSLKLIENTYQRIKLPLPDKSLFISAFEILYPKKMIKCFNLVHNNRIIGVRYALCYNNSIYDWFAGSDNNQLDKYPNDYLPYKIMEWGHYNGYKTFDFGGAGKPNEKYGVREFKLKFGGELVNLGRMEKVHKPLFLWVGKVGLLIYKVMPNVWIKAFK